MSPLAPVSRGIVAAFLLLLCVVALSPRAKAQTQDATTLEAGKNVRVCKLADLDSNVGFSSDGVDFIVAFNVQNISATPCVPEPSASLPMFKYEQVQKTKPFELCMDCEDRLPNGQYRGHDPVVLASGDFAHQTYRWKTVAPDGTVTCLQLQALFSPVLVAAPMLFKPVCSEIAVSRISEGKFVPPAPKNETKAGEAQSSEIFVLSSHKPRYYLDEGFSLHVDLTNLVASPPSGDDCPTFFLLERSSDGGTRYDQVSPDGFTACKTYMLGADRNKDWRTGLEVESGMSSRWTGVGAHSFQLFQLAGPSSVGTARFVYSNKLTIQIDDAALISRKWLGKAQGVGVDVTLDKDTYALGENVPLHIATENFEAPVPIYAMSATWDPYQAIDVEVRDGDGHLLNVDEKFPENWIWTGHGLGPALCPAGKLVTIERTLAEQAWLPNQPGTYVVVVTWHTLDGTNVKPGTGPLQDDQFKRYATVQATATFKVVAAPSGTATLPVRQRD